MATFLRRLSPRARLTLRNLLLVVLMLSLFAGSSAYFLTHAKPAHAATPSPPDPGCAPSCSTPFYFDTTSSQQVQLHPRIYLVFWGADWNTDPTLQNTMQSVSFLFNHLAGSTYNAILTQYSGTNGAVANDSQLVGQWVDANTPTYTYSHNDVGTEVAYAFGINHWTNSTDTQTIVLLDPNFQLLDAGQTNDMAGSQCGTHYFGTYDTGPHTASWSVSFSYVKHSPNFVNHCAYTGTPALSDQYADTASHEYAETVLDPLWDPTKAPVWHMTGCTSCEIGDACPYYGSFYGIQVSYLWDNSYRDGNHANGGCTLALGGSPAPTPVPPTPTPVPPSFTYNAAMQANTGNMYTAGTPGIVNTGQGMMAGTSPSIAKLTNGQYEMAFQANNGNLYTYGSDMHGSWGLGMMNGTSPSITALPNGGYEVAFQANTGQLWATGTAGTTNTGQGMMSGTSPSITSFSDGSYEIAFQANNSNLYSLGSHDWHGSWGFGMMSGTSPSITTLSNGGYEMAFQANTGQLWSVGSDSHGSWGDGMMSGTSPSITSFPNGTYEMAFQANTGNLFTDGTADRHGSWGDGMMSGTSPSITAVGYHYEMAFQANTSNLFTDGADRHGSWGQGMMSGTSPSIAP